jgi:DNA-binding transcriptional LysR family regulator
LFTATIGISELTWTSVPFLTGHDRGTDRAGHAHGGRGRSSYFKSRPEPKKPQDLIDHNCITLRLPHGGLHAWEFEKGGRELRVRVEGQLTYNTTAQMLNAALAGLGLAYVPEGWVQAYLVKRRLKRVLEDWCLPYSGYHLYYPSRRQPSAAFVLLVNALRYKG